MDVVKTKIDCPYLDTGICDYAGSEGCKNCVLATVNEKEAEDIANGWEVTQSYLPNDIDELHNSEYCQFCKDGKEKKDAYVLVEMAHHEPAFMSRKFFGLGPEVRAQVGSLLQIPVPICKKCRKLINKANNIKWIVTLCAIIVSMLVLAFIPSVTNAEGDLWYISFGVMIVSGFAGYLIGTVFEKKIREQLKTEIKDISEIMIIKKMLALGWYKFNATGVKAKSNYIIMKKKPREHVMFKRQDV